MLRPGFYHYSGGAQNKIFLHTKEGIWYAVFAEGSIQECRWDYIEQGLDAWDLVRIESVQETETETKDASDLNLQYPETLRQWVIEKMLDNDAILHFETADHLIAWAEKTVDYILTGKKP